MTRIADSVVEMRQWEYDELKAEIARLRSAFKFLIEEICDLEGREGVTDAGFVEQVIALAQSQRKVLEEK